jgi:hypothetical protein
VHEGRRSGDYLMKTDWVTHLRCRRAIGTRFECDRLVDVAIIMFNTIYPRCSRCAIGSTSTIDKLNLKYVDKTDYKVLTWNRGLEAAFNGQESTGKPGYREYLDNERTTPDRETGSVQAIGSQAGQQGSEGS